ncbi:unnamed protein product [Tetraodon nigroviridis]|uniref:(spotted green pufferfish) hypothetical protein n=1 Tax=Tetraodon nigroviridis TaxID=99883 RepID=Q4RMT8_TETNG|nr:unnamed protein product [Tetraodon nigroviridis]
MQQFEGLPVAETLRRISAQLGCSPAAAQVADFLDQHDQLRPLRDHFLLPKVRDLPPSDLSLVEGGEDGVYLAGNSLGLQPRTAGTYVQEELDKWARMGVHGHVQGSRPWAWAEDQLEEMMAKVVGAKAEEVALMNALTVNLHLLMLSFYRPTASRHKILLEDKAFPSDHYAVESQIRLRGFQPQESMLLLRPRPGEESLRTEDILRTIQEDGDAIAVVMLGAVQYYTGQLFDMAAITAAGQRKGCFVGFDCAHAAGNRGAEVARLGRRLRLLVLVQVSELGRWRHRRRLRPRETQPAHQTNADRMVGSRPEDPLRHDQRDAAAVRGQRLPAVQPAGAAALPPAGQSGGVQQDQHEGAAQEVVAADRIPGIPDPPSLRLRPAGAAGAARGPGAALQLLQGCAPLRGHAGPGAGRLQGPLLRSLGWLPG